MLNGPTVLCMGVSRDHIAAPVLVCYPIPCAWYLCRCLPRGRWAAWCADPPGRKLVVVRFLAT